jgi:hypothetical protein
MSIFESSDEESKSSSLGELLLVNKQKTNEDLNINSSEKTTSKGKKKQKETKITKKKEKTNKDSKKKEMLKDPKKIIDLNKKENEFSFCENLIPDIKIKKINEKGVPLNKDSLVKNRTNKAEEYYDKLFKNHEASNEFISEIEEKFKEFHKKESIFTLYYEIMITIERTDYNLIKNWLFYLLIKEVENKFYNGNNFEPEKKNKEEFFKEVENSPKKKTSKKRKRSSSMSEECPEIKKKRKYNKDQDISKGKTKKEENKKKEEKTYEKKKANDKVYSSKEKNKQKNTILEINVNTDTFNKPCKKKNKQENSIHTSDIASNKPKQIDKNRESVNQEANKINGKTLSIDNQSSSDPLQELIKMNTLRINKNKQQSETETIKENCNQSKIGWSFQNTSSSCSKEDENKKEKDIERIDLSSDT